MMNNNSGDWIVRLLTSVDSYANLVTTDGIERGGRITGFQLRSFIFNGKKIDVPTEIELNGDPNDRIPLDRIAQLDVG
jgi:hypothetical protein